MKRFTLLTLVMCLVFPLFAAADDAPEVAAARAAAVKHNEAIEAAEVRMERAILAAKIGFIEGNIAAKERMIDDLNRSLRVAARNENAENVVIISQQVTRLEAQVRNLKGEISEDYAHELE